MMLSVMRVAFDIATFPLFRNNDLFYPGIASILAIIRCGGEAIIFNSLGTTTGLELRLIKKLIHTFPGKVAYAKNSEGADMRMG
jgi:hypothetical protein